MASCSFYLDTWVLSERVLHHPQMETGRCSSVRIDSLHQDGRERVQRVWGEEEGGRDGAREGEAGKSEGEGRWRSTAVQIN